MKTHLPLFLGFLFWTARLHAGVIVTPGSISVHGRLEGDALTGQSIGETLDYLIFEVTTRTSVRLIATDITQDVFLAMAVVFPDNELTNAGQPYRLFSNYGQPPIPELTLVLNPGLFAVQVAVEAFREGDLADTFVPVSNSDEIISTVTYSFVLEGDIRGLQFLEGNRDRTFTVTQVVPEPTAAALICFSAAAVAFRRRRQ